MTSLTVKQLGQIALPGSSAPPTEQNPNYAYQSLANIQLTIELNDEVIRQLQSSVRNSAVKLEESRVKLGLQDHDRAAISSTLQNLEFKTTEFFKKLLAKQAILAGELKTTVEKMQGGGGVVAELPNP